MLGEKQYVGRGITSRHGAKLPARGELRMAEVLAGRREISPTLEASESPIRRGHAPHARASCQDPAFTPNRRRTSESTAAQIWFSLAHGDRRLDSGGGSRYAISGPPMDSWTHHRAQAPGKHTDPSFVPRTAIYT
jgi:hypothetical protein